MTYYQEYLEYKFISPHALRAGETLPDATVLTLGILLNEPMGYIALLPRKAREGMFASSIEVATADESKQKAFQQKPGVFDTYIHCVACGSLLSSDRCRRCRVKFRPQAIEPQGSPELPESVYQLALQHNLVFTKRPRTRK